MHTWTESRSRGSSRTMNILDGILLLAVVCGCGCQAMPRVFKASCM